MGLQVWYTHKTRNIVFPVCVTMTYRMKRMNTKRTEKSQLIVISITWIIKRIPFNVQFQHLAKNGQKLLPTGSVCLAFSSLCQIKRSRRVIGHPAASFMFILNWFYNVTYDFFMTWRDRHFIPSPSLCHQINWRYVIKSLWSYFILSMLGLLNPRNIKIHNKNPICNFVICNFKLQSYKLLYYNGYCDNYMSFP